MALDLLADLAALLSGEVGLGCRAPYVDNGHVTGGLESDTARLLAALKDVRGDFGFSYHEEVELVLQVDLARRRLDLGPRRSVLG